MDKQIIKSLSLCVLLSLFVVELSAAGNNTIREVEGMNYIVLKDSLPFAYQVSQPNKIYEIRNSFDLHEAVAVIGENSTLLFNGGILRNGTVEGHKTNIRADIRQIFNGDVVIKGDWRVDAAYPEWYGAKGDGITDDRIAIQKTIDAFSKIVLLNTTYLIGSVNNEKDKIGLELKVGKTLAGIRLYSTTHKKDQTQCVLKVKEDMDVESVIRINTLCELSHLGIVGNRVNPNSSCVSSNLSSRINLDNISVARSRVGFDMCSYLTKIESCIASYCDTGFSIKGEDVHNTTNILEKCFAVGCSTTGYYFDKMTYSSIISCAADGCGVFNESKLGFAYTLNQCSCLTFLSCGCEQCLKPLYCNMVQNISFLQCNFYINKNNLKLKNDFRLKDAIEIRHSLQVTIDNSVIDYSQMNKYIDEKTRLIHLYGVATDNVVLNYIPAASSSIKKANIGISGFLDAQKNIKYTDNTHYLTKGDMAHRPVFKKREEMAGFCYFDTTLGKPIWWNGRDWVDSNGNNLKSP